MIYFISYNLIFFRDKIKKRKKSWLDSWLTRDSRLTWARACLVQRYNSTDPLATKYTVGWKIQCEKDFLKSFKKVEYTDLDRVVSDTGTSKNLDSCW